MAKKKSEPRQNQSTEDAERSTTTTGDTERRRGRRATGPQAATTKEPKGAKGAKGVDTGAATAAQAGAQTRAPAKSGRDEAEDDRHSERGDASSPESEESPSSTPDVEGDDEIVEVVGEIVEDDVPLDSEAESTMFDRNDRSDSSVLPSSPPSEPGSEGAALSRTDPLQAYLREVQRHPLLSPEDEKRLTVHYVKTQDVATAARLVTANLRLVVKLAYEYRRAYKNIMDLIQEGNIGLMQAVKRYDPYRGVKLSSYAAWWIRAYILRFILNNWRLVKLGTTQAQRKLFFNLNKEKAKLAALGIEPTASEIARRLSVDEKEVVDMDRRLSSGDASLDAPVGDAEGRAIARVELLPSMTTGPDSALEAMEVGELVHDRLNRFRETLKGKDVVIFDKRMAAEEPLTLQELGDEFGISRERVRQLEARLTTKLRQYLKEELGDAVGAS